MATLTIRLPDDKHSRLKQLASYRQISMNKLIEVDLLSLCHLPVILSMRGKRSSTIP